MAITYPLTLPTNKNIKSVDFRAINAVAYSSSPFTFSGQAFAYCWANVASRHHIANNEAFRRRAMGFMAN
jgi:hypothetical protein